MPYIRLCGCAFSFSGGCFLGHLWLSIQRPESVLAAPVEGARGCLCTWAGAAGDRSEGGAICRCPWLLTAGLSEVLSQTLIRDLRVNEKKQKTKNPVLVFLGCERGVAFPSQLLSLKDRRSWNFRQQEASVAWGPLWIGKRDSALDLALCSWNGGPQGGPWRARAATRGGCHQPGPLLPPRCPSVPLLLAGSPPATPAFSLVQEPPQTHSCLKTFALDFHSAHKAFSSHGGCGVSWLLCPY